MTEDMPPVEITEEEAERIVDLLFDRNPDGSMTAPKRTQEQPSVGGPQTEAGRRFMESLEWSGPTEEQAAAAILAIEAEARAASQERPQPDYRPEFPNECGWVGALGWADYETPNGRPCTLPDDHEGPHQRNPVGASQERPQPHGPNDGCGELLWAHMEAQPGFSEELRQAEAELAEGRGTPFHEAGVAQERPSIDVERDLLAEAIFESGVKQTMSQSEQAADNILAELAILRSRLSSPESVEPGE
jgi:hypothetical protein